MLKPEENEPGRYRLTEREYAVLLNIFAALSAIVQGEGVIKDRLKAIPNAFRDYRMVTSRLDKVMNQLVGTVPTRKLMAIKNDLNNVNIHMVIGKNASLAKARGESVVYVNEDALIALIDSVVGMNCLLCEKTGKDAKRCPYRKLIEDVLPYEMDEESDPADGTCQMAGRTTISYEPGERTR